jgi:hypothetical protein
MHLGLERFSCSKPMSGSPLPRPTGSVVLGSQTQIQLVDGLSDPTVAIGRIATITDQTRPVREWKDPGHPRNPESAKQSLGILVN